MPDTSPCPNRPRASMLPHEQEVGEMCGRYGLAVSLEEVAERFGVVQLELSFEPRYNAAPTQTMPVVLEDGERRLAAMRWGYEPEWLRERRGRPLINARDDRLRESRTFRGALRERRAIVPVTHWYEWAREGNGRVPYVFRGRGGEVLGLAGLYFEDGDERSYVIITTSPNPLAARVHDRMPAVLRREDEEAWLDPDRVEADDLVGLLGPYPEDGLEAYPVSRKVNSPANDSEELLRPV